MKIHKSFSKLEIIEIFKEIDDQFNIEKSQSKKEVIDYITKNFRKFEIRNPNNFYKITTTKELKFFLKNQNANKILSVKDKNNIIIEAKRILNYCNNDYDLSQSTFNDIEQLISTAEKIKKYGYISSVRKAIKKLNNDYKVKDKLEVNIPDTVEQSKNIIPVKVRTGKFRLDMNKGTLEVIEEY